MKLIDDDGTVVMEGVVYRVDSRPVYTEDGKILLYTLHRFTLTEYQPETKTEDQRPQLPLPDNESWDSPPEDD